MPIPDTPIVTASAAAIRASPCGNNRSHLLAICGLKGPRAELRSTSPSSSRTELSTHRQRDINVAAPVVRAAQILKLALLGQPGSVLEAEDAHRVAYVAEGFPDRRYQDDGSSTPQPDGAVLKTRPKSRLGVATDGRGARYYAMHPR